jgi:hypothetical protein
VITEKEIRMRGGEEAYEEDLRRQANSPEFHEQMREIARMLQFGRLFRAECKREYVSPDRCEELMRMATLGHTTIFPANIETQQQADDQAKARDEAIPLLLGVCATDKDFPECKQLAVLPTLSFTVKNPRQ